jgi:hypothetical protein
VKTRSTANFLSLLSLALAGVTGAFAQTTPHQQHTVTEHTQVSLSAHTSNGQTVVTYNGREVFSGPTTGHVTTRSSSSNGVACAAAFDGDKVLWENRPGSAQHLKAADKTPAAPAHHQPSNPHHPPATGPSQSAAPHQPNLHSQNSSAHQTVTSTSTISVKTVNHQTVVVYNGQDYPVGATHGQVSAKAKTIDGVSYAAAFDGDRVVWENVAGAAHKVR